MATRLFRKGSVYLRWIRRRIAVKWLGGRGAVAVDRKYGGLYRALAVANGKNPNRGLMFRMMEHFGFSPRLLAAWQWGEVKGADRTCSKCGQVKRCQRWMSWGRKSDAPRIFCPNSSRFDELEPVAARRSLHNEQGYGA